MKRIVVCLDGTWQTLSQADITNIGIIARSVAHKETRPDGSFIDQTVIYAQGVGSTIGGVANRDPIAKLFANVNHTLGGAFGEGLDDLILDTYLRVAFNYEKGDEIYIFGFSRGAFAARRLAGFIETAGIVSRLHTDRAFEGYQLYLDKPWDHAPEEQQRTYADQARQFRELYGKGERNNDGTRRATDDVPPIKFLGVFDTVAQRGMREVIASFTPWDDSKRFRFANYRISSNVENARHAVALDENRVGYPVLLWEGLEERNQQAGREALQQRWFVGGHSDIGGGEASKLAALTLKWISDGARDAGLRFYASYGKDLSPIEEALRQAGVGFQADITRVKGWAALQPVNYPWRGRKVWMRREQPTAQDLQRYLDASVLERAKDKRLKYKPAPLKPFRKVIKDWKPSAPG